MTENEHRIHECLDSHKSWLAGNYDSQRAILPGEDFREISFFIWKCNLSGADLQGVNFERNATLDTSRFQKADLRGANFKEVCMMWSQCQYGNFQGADFRGAILTGSNFEKANLEEVDFREACMLDVILTNSNIKNANFWGTDLFSTDVKNNRDIRWEHSKQHPIWKKLFDVKNYDLADKVFQSFLQEK